MDRHTAAGLDAYITGNGGEDQFTNTVAERLYEVVERYGDDPESDYCEIHTATEIGAFACYQALLPIIEAPDFFDIRIRGELRETRISLWEPSEA